jgi:CubicO group peptidase (beta-lactamase class C family)
MGRIHRKISRLISGSIAVGLFPGASWLVEKKGREESRGSLGNAQVVPIVRPMAGNTIFDLASITKPICTGTLSMIFWQDGILDPGEKVGQYLPEFSGAWRDDVTVGQVLSHSSGLPSGIPLSEVCSTRGEVLERVCKVEKAYEPGTRTLYSDTGFILMGGLLERLAGEALDSLASRRIFYPLSMVDTAFTPAAQLRNRIAATQNQPERGGVLVGEVHDGNARFMGGVSGHAGLFSTVDDLAAFSRAMLGRGATILDREIIERATETWSDDGDNAYGLSWFKRKSPINMAGTLLSDRAYGHTGYTGTSIWVDPAQDLIAILLTNRVHPERVPERIPEMNQVRARFHDIAGGA